MFQLGRKYAEALGLKVLDENGKLVTVTMGSYGVGITRNLALIAEANSDERGLVWPEEVSPFDLHLIATGKDPQILAAAEQLFSELGAAGVDVLFDDRPRESPGLKFKDAELLGIPKILFVGRGVVDGTVEMWDRRTGERTSLPLTTAAADFAR